MRPSGAIQMAAYKAAGGGGGPVGVVQNTGRKGDQTGANLFGFSFTPATPFTSGNYVIVPISVFTDQGSSSSLGAATVTINGTTASLSAVRYNDSFILGIFYGIAGAGSAGVDIEFNHANLPYNSGIFINSGAIECDDITAYDSSASDQVGPLTNNDPKITTNTLAQSAVRIISLVGTGNSQTVNITKAAADTIIWQDNDGNSSCPATCAYRNGDGTTSGQLIDWAADISTTWSMLSAVFKK